MFLFLVAQDPELIPVWKTSKVLAVWLIWGHLHAQESPEAIPSSYGSQHKGETHSGSGSGADTPVPTGPPIRGELLKGDPSCEEGTHGLPVKCYM